MNFATNSLSVVELSPEKAAEYLRNNYIHNRKLRPHHVKFLANEMAAGRFISTAEIHLMYKNGEPVLVNGQHTCAAIVQYGKPVRVTLRKEVVRESGQIAMAYAFGHDTGLRRTFSDATGAYGMAEITGLSVRQVDYLATAIKHIVADFSADDPAKGKRSSTPADLIEDIQRWAPIYRSFLRATSGDDKAAARTLQKRGSLSVVLVTMYYRLETALDFWPQVIRPDALRWDDPRFSARRVLLDSKGAKGTATMKPATLSRSLARCWNAYFRGDAKLSKVYPQPNGELIKIEGTPYTGHQPEGFIPLATKVVSDELQLLSV